VTLAALIDQLRAAAGLRHKADIAPVLERLNITGHEAIAIGDDCAAIPDGDGYLLFAIEGFVPGFVQAEPHFAGYCGVMVNLSDIAAMGGRPIAVVDAIWARDAEEAAPVLAGLADAAQRYGVPIVGGHTNTRAPAGMLSVAVLGRARKLLTSFAAQPGQVLLAAIDLRGTMRASGPYWDASTGAAPADLRENLDILAELAEDGLCAAAKDISMAGLAGTAIMFMEASGCGAVIDLNAAPAGDAIGYLAAGVPELRLPAQRRARRAQPRAAQIQPARHRLRRHRQRQQFPQAPAQPGRRAHDPLGCLGGQADRLRGTDDRCLSSSFRCAGPMARRPGIIRRPPSSAIS
jgi:AIR synthase-related protein